MVPPKVLTCPFRSYTLYICIYIKHYGQVNTLRLKSSVSSKWASKLTPLGAPFILQLMVHNVCDFLAIAYYCVRVNI